VDYETGGRINRKEKWYKISLHPHIPYTSQMGIQTKGTKKNTC
jgi:hypothetical protein